jgi:type VI secretion system Hcp family effector
MDSITYKRCIKVIFFFVFIFACLPQFAQAATVQGFLRIPSVTEGCGIIPGFTDSCEIYGFHHNVSHNLSTGETYGGRSNFTLEISKKIDKASPYLFFHAVQGNTLPHASLRLIGSGNNYAIILSELHVVRVEQDTNPDHNFKTADTCENVTLDFKAILWRWQPDIVYGWNLLTNSQYFPPPPPTVTGITPSSGMRGTTVMVTDITGSGFVSGAIPALFREGQPLITGSDVVYVSPTRMRCNFTIPATTTTGQWSILVVNPDEQLGGLSNGFTITGQATNTQTKIGLFRNGFWILDYNGNFQWSDVGTGNDLVAGFGMAGDKPVIGNWNHTIPGDKIGVFRNGTWLMDYNGNFQWDGVDKSAYLGQAGDIPVIGDWNNNGDKKIGVFRNGFWMLDGNGNYNWDGTGTGLDVVAGFGQAGDVPVVGNWDGSGQDKIGLFRNGFWILDYNGNFQWNGIGTGNDLVAGFGASGDVPVVRDWDGDGTSEIAVFRASAGQWIIDNNGNYLWDGTGPGQDVTMYLGQNGDVAIAGDWNSNGKDKLGIFRNGFWILDHDGSFLWEGPPTDRVAGFGQAGDIPVPGKWNSGGTTGSSLQAKTSQTPDKSRPPSINANLNGTSANVTTAITTIVPAQTSISVPGNSSNSSMSNATLPDNASFPINETGNKTSLNITVTSNATVTQITSSGNSTAGPKNITSGG